MRKEYSEYLCRKYPKIYPKPTGKDPKELHEPFELFGFECRDGWFRLLVWLSRYIQHYLDTQNEMAKKYPDTYPVIDQVRAVQVKEKFGTLRFYTEGGNERTQSVIAFAEYLSGFICETTGKTDDIGYNKKGWIKTHHKSLAKKGDFHFVDDPELRELISGQTEFNFDSKQ